MTPITLEDIALPALVSVIHAYQLGTFARRVGAARTKFKVPPPETTGDPVFVRTLRAQQNAIEFSPMFYTVLWSASLFFCPVPATLAGIAYVIARQRYFDGYVKNPEKRVRPFYATIWSLQALFAMSAAGLLQVLLLRYAGVDAKELVLRLPGMSRVAQWL